MAARVAACCVFLLLVGVSLAGAPSRAFGAKLYIVYASISGTQAVAWIAKDAGSFAKHGLDVDLLFAGGGRAITSLLGGDTPIVTVGGPSAIAARLAGSGRFPMTLARLGPSTRSMTRKCWPWWTPTS